MTDPQGIPVADQAQAGDQLAPANEPDAPAPPTAREAEANDLEPSTQIREEQAGPPVSVAPAQADRPVPEAEPASAGAQPAAAAQPAQQELQYGRTSSCESHLDKQAVPLPDRLKDALKDRGRVDPAKVCAELGVPQEEFDRAKVLLLEAREIKEEATELPPVIWLPLTEEGRREHQADLALVRANPTYQALKRIHDRASYRDDYPSWLAFLELELGHEDPNGYWQDQVRQDRITRQLAEQNLKLPKHLNKAMAKHLNKVRDDASMFASCVKEFTERPLRRQTAKEMAIIVEQHQNRKAHLLALRRDVPDVTDAEVAMLSAVYAADPKWRRWYGSQQDRFRELLRSGRPPRDCLLQLAAEVKTLPTPQAILGVARGAAVQSLVNDLIRPVPTWEADARREKEWQEAKQRLKDLARQRREARQRAAKAVAAPTGAEAPEGGPGPAPGDGDEGEGAIYELTVGQQTAAMAADHLAAFLYEQAESVENGEDIPDFTVIRVHHEA
jgi:hypothetical protein